MAERGLRRFIITVTVISAAVIELIDSSIVNVALSDMSGNLGATLEDTAWVITAYAIANVIIIPMTSFLAARLGRRNYYVGSIILFTIASFFCGNAPNIWVLVAFRFLQGIGGGALLSTSQAILFEAYTPEERGMASGIFGLGIVIGPTIGPTLGGWIVDTYSWPWIFYVNLPIGTVAAILSILYVKEPAETRRADTIDWYGIILLIVGVGSLQTVLERGQTEDWFATPYISVLTATAAICFVVFIVWELSIENPVVDLAVLTRSRTLSIAAFLTFILGFALFSSVFMVPVFTQQLLGFTPLQTGLLLLPGAMTAGAILPNIGRMVGKGVPPQYFIVGGFGLTALFTWMMSHATLASGEPNFFWPLIIRGVGIAFLTVPLTVLAVSELRGRDIPQGSALNNMMRQLGGSFGIAFINTYVARRMAANRNMLVEHVSIFDPATQERLAALRGGFAGRGSPPDVAVQQSYGALEGIVSRQAAFLSYIDAFLLVSIICLCCIPLVALVRPKKNAGPVHVSLSDH